MKFTQNTTSKIDNVFNSLMPIDKKAVISEDKPTIVLRRNDLHALEKRCSQ